MTYWKFNKNCLGSFTFTAVKLFFSNNLAPNKHPRGSPIRRSHPEIWTPGAVQCAAWYYTAHRKADRIQVSETSNS